MRLTTDLFAYCAEHVPRWNTVSISGYHFREKGCSAVQEVAFTLANGMAYVQAAIDAGLEVDEFAPRLAFFFNGHNNVFQEVAKFRAARRIWAEAMRERFGATNPKAQMIRFHTQTGGVTLTAQQPVNNIVRVALQAFAAVCGGTQSLHTNGYDEALALPSERAAKIALRTQQIIAHESGAADTVDPFAGSYYVEALTDEIERRARALIERDRRAGRLGRRRSRSSRTRSRSPPSATTSATGPSRTSSSASTSTSRRTSRSRTSCASTRRPSARRSSGSTAFKAGRDQALADAPARGAAGRVPRRREPAAADPPGAQGLRARWARSAARCARSSGTTSPSLSWTRLVAGEGTSPRRAKPSAMEAKRTLVKSPPELWAELSDMAALARHLGEFGEIRITRTEPETVVEWEGDLASGSVRLEPSGWGTKVTLTALPVMLDPPPSPSPSPSRSRRRAPAAARVLRAAVPPPRAGARAGARRRRRAAAGARPAARDRGGDRRRGARERARRARRRAPPPVLALTPVRVRAAEPARGTHAARHHRPMPLRAGILSLAVLLLAAAPARAAFDVTAFELTPSSTAAGAHADVTIATSFPPYDAASPPQRPRNVTFHLPPGLAGDPFATPRCTEADYRADACPAATRIGSVAAKRDRARCSPLPAAGRTSPATSTTSCRPAPSPRGSAP